MTFVAALLLVASAQTDAAAPPAPPPAASTPALPAGPRTLGPIDEARFNACHDAAVADALNGVVEANAWLIDGGTYLARQCLGFAYSLQQQYGAAEAAFARAASDAEVARDPRAATLWVQAGNAALAGGDAPLARRRFDAALAQGQLSGLPLGEAYLDRARAALAQSDWAAARADLDIAGQTAAQDPLLWLLSATLARRQEDMVRARADIDFAIRLAPRDAAVALEAGNIAAALDDLAGARRYWESASALGGASPPGDTARARLADLTAFEAAATAPPGAPPPPAPPPPAPQPAPQPGS